jgi:solute carrier family 25 (mitochondrial aspartate/glutamate transporter), member 12/13
MYYNYHSSSPQQYCDTYLLNVVFTTQGERLLTLLRLLRGDSEFINFRDFTVFNLLMTRPDPEFDIAFMLMDRDHKGYLTRDDVSAFLLHNRRSQAVQFDMNCDVVQRYFGRNGDRRLRVDAFSLFFLSLQSEVAQQAFKRFDPDDTGFINREDLVSLLTNFRGWRINEGVADRIRGENPNRRFSFAEFVAYQNVMVHMPSLVTSINIACDVKKEAISKDDMKVMARTLLGNKLSRMEADAVFDVFDINKVRAVACVWRYHSQAPLVYAMV